MHFDNPTFDTTPTCIPDALVPTFKSVVTFNGKSYTGEPGQSKKEAERLAARAAILSLLGKNTRNLANDMLSNESCGNMCCWEWQLKYSQMAILSLCILMQWRCNTYCKHLIQVLWIANSHHLWMAHIIMWAMTNDKFSIWIILIFS